MIKIENTDVYGWEAAIRGARNPMNSWDKMDSFVCEYDCCDCGSYYDCDENGTKPYIIGKNDHKLLRNLTNAGPDHGKFMRMITVSLDITAPLYWWKEFDTYKVGTVANSCSTMHKIHAKEFTLDDFSHEHLLDFEDNKLPEDMAYLVDTTVCDCGCEHTLWFDACESLRTTILALNCYRKKFLETKDKKYWWQMIQLLPTSYNQRRTVLLNYQVLKSMYHARKNHKLDEWHTFCDWIRGLPYSELITGGDNDET